MYHHTVMPLAAWGATKYFPGGHGTFIGKHFTFVSIHSYAIGVHQFSNLLIIQLKFHRSYKQLRTHHYVLLLPTRSHAATVSGLSVVEEVHHDATNGNYTQFIKFQF